MNPLRALSYALALVFASTLVGQTAAVALHEHNYPLAEELSIAALKQEPGNPKALVNLGLALEGEKKFDEAISHWESLKGQSGKELPTRTQLDQRIKNLLGPLAASRNYCGALLNTRTHQLELAFSAVNVATAVNGYHETFQLSAFPEGAKVYPLELATRNGTDHSVQVCLKNSGEGGKVIFMDFGRRATDGSVRVQGGDYILLLRNLKVRAWDPQECARYSWTVSNFSFGESADLAIHAWGGNDSYFLPPYGFGGLLTVDDGALGYEVIYSMLAKDWIYAKYWKDDGKIYFEQAMNEQGNFFYLIRKNLIFIDTQKARESQASMKRLIQAYSDGGALLRGFDFYTACGWCPSLQLNTSIRLAVEAQLLSSEERATLLKEFHQGNLSSAIANSQGVSWSSWGNVKAVVVPALFPDNMLFYGPDPSLLRQQRGLLAATPGGLHALALDHQPSPGYGPMGYAVRDR